MPIHSHAVRASCVTLALTCAWLPVQVAAQDDSVFADYATYEAFVDDRIMSRDWVPLITRLGARDEYTQEQLAAIDRQFNGTYPSDFTAKALLTPSDLGAGFRHEIRSYWGPSGYVWFGALLHERDDDVIVIHFRLNSDIQPIMQTYGP